MVAKRAAGVAGAAAGGFLNNPGALAAIGIVVSIITTLVIFRNDIRDFFGGIGEGFGQITLPAITFPTFEFPDITFPSFPDITFPTFEFPDINITFPTFEDIFMVPGPFVDEERMDVPFPTEEDPDKIIDIVPDVTGGRGERLRGVIGADEDEGFPQEGMIARVLREIPFAVENVPETQVEFQERAAAFVQALPEVTAFTSLPGAATDFVRRQLSRESEDFADVLAAEARRSETIFAGLFGNVQNPEFGA